MTEGSQCEICFVGTLYLQEGLLVCDSCGVFSQAFVEETQEYQAGISDAGFMQKSQQQSASQKEDIVVEKWQEHDVSSIPDALIAYIDSMQDLLKRQITTLIDKFKVSESIRDVAKDIWFSYLAVIKILEPAFSEELEAKVKARQAVHQANIKKQFRAFSVMSSVIEPEIHHILPLSTPLFILFLASWYTRQAIDPLDITQLALDGHLPYLRFYADYKGKLVKCQKVLGESFLSPSGVPSPSFIQTRSVELAQRVGLQCPPINATLWLRRYVSELDLPDEVFAVASQLYDVYGQSKSSVLGVTSVAAHVHPWAHVMSFIVMAMRLMCDMDGKKAVIRKPHIEGKWVEWAKQVMARAPAMSFYPLSTHDALQMDLPGLKKYLEYLHETFLCGRNVPMGLEELKRLLLQFASTAGNERVEHMETDAMDGDDDEPLLKVVDVVDEESMIEHTGKAYGHYAFRSPGTDYLAIVTVASLRSWIAPSVFLEAVRVLEERMIEAECRIVFNYKVNLELIDANVDRQRQGQNERRRSEQDEMNH